ncbi:hypothetical protein ACF09C_15870 [Streptomyces sp. NPDC014870]|uniref:hypothetical protein n=1 Tax=Streptomyces sp. NPDC014870 TaxID=3364925 RepID=UPI0036FDDD52
MIFDRAEGVNVGRTGTLGRRALLAAGAVTLVGCTAEGGPGRPRKPSADELAARAEAALRRRSAATSRTLLERYDAVLAAHPALTARLTPLRSAVAAHAAALAEGAEALDAYGRSGSGTTGGTPGAAGNGAAGKAAGNPTAAGTPGEAGQAVDAAETGNAGGAGNAAPSADTRSADPGDGRTTTPAASAPATPTPLPVPADPALALKDLAALARRTADTHAAALLDAPPEYARLLASVAASGAAHAYLLTEGGRA